MIPENQTITFMLSILLLNHVARLLAFNITAHHLENSKLENDIKPNSKNQVQNNPTPDASTISGQMRFEPVSTPTTTLYFNLDDLEDVHESSEKSSSNRDEVNLLRNEQAPGAPDTIQKTIISDNQHHVFKISNSVKQKSKSIIETNKNDIPKRQISRLNSVERQSAIVINSTETKLTDINEFIKILNNLYNHYHWQASEIRKNVSPACGVEFHSYLSALSHNAEWAQRVYDSSGQNRGQFLYGNDLWLGEKMFCEEVNHHIHESDRKQFAFGFFIARVSINNFPTPNQTRILNVGECLPKSCTPKDVTAILKLDPTANIFKAPVLNERIHMEVISVRSVPGQYLLSEDKGFYILCTIFLTMATIVMISTIYDRSFIQPETKHGNTNNQKDRIDPENGKKCELLQMQDVKNFTTNTKNTLKTTESHRVNPIDADKKLSKITISSCHEIHCSVSGKILQCFSLRRNVKTILASNNYAKNPFAAIHGIRVLSLLWTMVVHTYIFLFNVGENRYRRTITERSFAFQLIANATFSVDTFFFISGFLLAYVFLNEGPTTEQHSTCSFMKKGALRSLVLLFYRYIRLTPTYLFVLFFNRFALEFVLNDSVFTPNPIDYPACKKYWWRNVLYINNWFPFSEFCMHWSWYLANDMQFFLMGTILLIVSKRYFNVSASILLIFLCSSWATAGIISLHFNYVFEVARPFLSFDILYDKPWQRIGPYIIGMIAAYIFHMVKTPPRFPRTIILTLWVCTFGLLFALVFGVWSGQLELLSTAFYVGMGHTAWAIGLLWIVLSCCWGLCPPINSFLSCRGFVPFSRLTYCTYLIHPIIISIVTFHMKGPMNLQHPIILTIFLGYMVISFIAGLIISLLFESPMINLSKIILRRK